MSECNGHRAGFVALVGPANAGKSTLLNALMGCKVSIVSPKEQTTRNRILAVKSRKEWQAVFLDTPGFLARRYRGELARFLTDAFHRAVVDVDLAVLVIDAVQAAEKLDFVMQIAASVRQREIMNLKIIALNKVDKIEKPRLLPLLARLDEEFRPTEEGRDPLAYMPISALTGEGLSELEEKIVGYLPPGPALYPEDMETEQPEQFLGGEIVREKLMLYLQKELPYSVAVAVEDWREENDLLHISATIIVERKSQKGIVIGQKGEMLKKIGTAARQELEKVFGMHVFLELFVVVEANWTRTSRGMRRAGYES